MSNFRTGPVGSSVSTALDGQAYVEGGWTLGGGVLKGVQSVWGAIEIEARGLGADDAWLENGWKFPQFSVFANKGRCLIFGFVGVQVCIAVASIGL